MPSEEGIKQLYSRYEKGVDEYNQQNELKGGNKSFEKKARPENFNRSLAEYYGQQGLLLSGRTPVSDQERSDYTQYRNRTGDKTSAYGTNRLIEQTYGMSDDERLYQKDYRYKDPSGRIIVGDSQTLPSAGGKGTSVWGDIFNASRLDPSLSNNRGTGLKYALMDKAAEVRSRGENLGMDTVIKELMDEGVLPPLKGMRQIKGNREQGIELGKATGKSPIFKTISDNNPSQKDLDEIVFSEMPADFRERIGARPINMTIADTGGMNRAMIDPTILDPQSIQHYPINEITDPNSYPEPQQGKTRVSMNTNRLAGQGIARPLLSRHLMQQLR